MKIILTGSTGLVGRAVLQQCLRHPAITSIVVLSRRPLAQVESNPKLKVVLVDDFLAYSAETRAALRNTDACIWSLGKPYTPDATQTRIVHFDYTVYGIRVLAEEKKAEKAASYE